LSITYPNAIDQIFDTFLLYWNANIASVSLGYTPKVLWRHVEEASIQDTTRHYLRVSQQTIIERQSTLKNVKTLYDTIGFIKIQFYFSKATLNSSEDADMTTIARDAFRKAPSSDVWYRNSRILELPPEEDYYRADVISNYTYSESI
jgi:hypothetical protein